MDDLVIETRGLCKQFAGFIAVQDVDLQVRRGSIHALIGPNGAGKTTVFNLLTKFFTPSRGQILYDGRDITGARPADLARQGMVRSFQISATFPHLTVRENVRVALQRELGTSYHFWRSETSLAVLNERAGELLEAVGLAGQADQLMGPEADRARALLENAHDRLERGGLAGAVAAEQRHDLALAHGQVDAVQHMRLAVEPVHGLEPQHVARALAPLRHGRSPYRLRAPPDCPRPPHSCLRRARGRVA